MISSLPHSRKSLAVGKGRVCKDALDEAVEGRAADLEEERLELVQLGGVLGRDGL